MQTLTIHNSLTLSFAVITNTVIDNSEYCRGVKGNFQLVT